jgi:hypothetical protein
MLILIGVGILSLVGYQIFNWKYPKPVQSVADEFSLNTPVILGTNIISPDPKIYVQKGKETFKVYRFSCYINPDRASIAGKVVEMNVPDEYLIEEFSILTDPKTNEVKFVHLGNQYHSDKDPVSKCLCLVDLYLENLDYRFMERLMELLSTYDLFDSYCHDHWSNREFCKINTKVVDKMAKISEAA